MRVLGLERSNESSGLQVPHLESGIEKRAAADELAAGQLRKRGHAAKVAKVESTNDGLLARTQNLDGAYGEADDDAVVLEHRQRERRVRARRERLDERAVVRVPQFDGAGEELDAARIARARDEEAAREEAEFAGARAVAAHGPNGRLLVEIRIPDAQRVVGRQAGQVRVGEDLERKYLARVAFEDSNDADAGRENIPDSNEAVRGARDQTAVGQQLDAENAVVDAAQMINTARVRIPDSEAVGGAADEMIVGQK